MELELPEGDFSRLKQTGNGLFSCHSFMRKPCIVLALAIAVALRSLGADAPTAATSTSELSYDDIKKQFEKDENLEGVRVSSFSATDVTVIYKGRYVVYKLANLGDAQRKK